MDKKYFVMPGVIISENDGQESRVSALQLMKLYQVPTSECIIMDSRSMMKPPKNLLALRPRYDGNYSIESLKEELLEEINT